MTEETKAFGSYDNGFTLTFESGLVLSTRFGPGNYCENFNSSLPSSRNGFSPSPKTPKINASDTAEIGVWDSAETSSRHWITEWQTAVFGVVEPADDVRGYVSLAEWLQILDWCKEWKR